MNSPNTISKDRYNVQAAMARYCEPYFDAVNRWITYNSIDLIVNRIMVIEAIVELLKTWVLKSETYNFILITENDVDLLPETFPEAGVVFKENNDKIAFASAQKKLLPTLFQSGGWYFQSEVLKPLAGINETTLALSNGVTRSSALELLRKLFRLQETSGKATIMYTADIDNQPQEYSLEPLCDRGMTFVTHITNIRAELPANSRHVNNRGDSPEEIKVSTPITKKTNTKNTYPIKSPSSLTKPSKSKIMSKSKGSEVKISSAKRVNAPILPPPPKKAKKTKVSWNRTHESVGIIVAKWFESETTGHDELFTGKISKYLPPSEDDENDQLYHVVYTDGDEEDLNEIEFQECYQLFLQQPIIWGQNHSFIGSKVGKFVKSIPSSEDETDMTIIIENSTSSGSDSLSVLNFHVGEVSRCTLGRFPRDTMFEVAWDNGEIQNINEDEYNRFLENYNTHQSNGSAITDINAAPNYSSDNLKNVSELAENTESPTEVEVIDIPPEFETNMLNDLE